MEQEQQTKGFDLFYKSKPYRVNYIPMDSRERTSRWGGQRNNGVDFENITLYQVKKIICSGEIKVIRELSRYFYRTSGIYRHTIDFLSNLSLYDTAIFPIFESGKGSKAQITKAFYSACDFVEALDIKNTLSRITREWLKSGVYYGILQERGSKVVVQDLPVEFCRTRFKDLNNLNILEFNVTYFDSKYPDEMIKEAELLNFPEIIQRGYREWKRGKVETPWVLVQPSNGAVVFCFAEDQTPPFLAAIPDLIDLDDATDREKTRDQNELYKLLIQRMPISSDGHLVFELDEVAKIHAGTADMLQNLETVDVLTTFGDTTMESLQDSTAATQSMNRIEKYKDNAWDALGLSSLLFNADNSSSLAYVIKRMEGEIKNYINIYATWIKFLINSRFTRPGLKFDFMILPTTLFNIKEYQDLYLQGAQFGYSKMLAGVAMGVKQRNLISTIDFENEFLGLTEKMLPLLSSYTQTGNENSAKKSESGEKNSNNSAQVKDINNKGGRPALAPEERSQKTQSNIDSKG